MLTLTERQLIDSPKVPRKEIERPKEPSEERVPAAEAPAQETLEVQKPEKMRRATSLKTGKTPPGTPGRRKLVRYDFNAPTLFTSGIVLYASIAFPVLFLFSFCVFTLN